MKQTGLFIKYANNGNESVDGTSVVFTFVKKDDLEQKMSEHYQEPVRVLFIDSIDDRTLRDTIITIGKTNYNAFTTIVDVH